MHRNVKQWNPSEEGTRCLRLCSSPCSHQYCRQTSNISRNLVSNKIGDHSNVVGAAPTSSFSIKYLLQMIAQRIDGKHLKYEVWCDLYKRFHGISFDIALDSKCDICKLSNPQPSIQCTQSVKLSRCLSQNKDSVESVTLCFNDEKMHMATVL